jgi:hypothetical protein
MQVKTIPPILPLLATLIAGSAAAQESVSVGAPRTAVTDTARVEQLFEPSATATDGDAPLAFPGTSERRDEFASSIPVFVPGGLFEELERNAIPFAGTSRGFEGEAEGASILFDEAGYFATLDFERFRMTVEGTNVVHGTPAELEATASIPAVDYYTPFALDYAGAAIQFGFAGVDYLVQFECKTGPIEDGEGPSCITEEEAERLLSAFLVCNADAQCLRRDPKDLTAP